MEAAITIRQTTDAQIQELQPAEKRSTAWLTQEIRAPLLSGASTGFQRCVGILGPIRAILWDDRAIYAIVALHAAIGIVAIAATGDNSAFAYLAYFPTWPFIFLIFFPFVYALLILLQVVHRLDRRRGMAARLVLSDRRLAHFGAGLVLLCAMMIFQGTFTSLKNAFPTWWGGFPYDVVQADLDRVLHFGRDPWHYLYVLGANGFVRGLVEWNYNQGWFVLCFSALFWVAVSYEARAIRTRYFLCYVLVWIIIGNLFAGLFLSAGPAFYGHVTGDTARFAGQLAFLGQSDWGMHSAVRMQQYLWATQQRGEAGFGSGIAAFPSMHVGLVTLNALFLFEHNRKAGLAAFAYVALVVASSVYLAWHYAIDGYCAIIVTVVIYSLARRAFGPLHTEHHAALNLRPAQCAIDDPAGTNAARRRPKVCAAPLPRPGGAAPLRRMRSARGRVGRMFSLQILQIDVAPQAFGDGAGRVIRQLRVAVEEGFRIAEGGLAQPHEAVDVPAVDQRFVGIDIDREVEEIGDEGHELAVLRQFARLQHVQPSKIRMSGRSMVTNSPGMTS